MAAVKRRAPRRYRLISGLYRRTDSSDCFPADALCQKPGHGHGRVSASRRASQTSASSREVPHISACGCRPEQQAGRSGLPKIAQRRSSPSCTQRTPAGLPFGMPGIGLVIDGAIQHAPQSGRHA
ncbi:hypothetical protein BZM27_32085 [Paraburkholderia steynii]|uniref:Uncharacterized protein n=1 Tax=Paraburkholderia steynii TaxID=1245441 RepID=A0A4R0X6Q0_9BURK|nr:hypothetical protein BZM27_32085 [Paraburkholderia steynii]